MRQFRIDLYIIIKIKLHYVSIYLLKRINKSTMMSLIWYLLQQLRFFMYVI